MKPQTTTQPTAAYLAKLDRALRDTSAAEEEYRFVGCTASESAFSGDKVYAGGPTGASFTLAKQHAAGNRKKYFAVARYGNDGHVFAFNRLVKGVENIDEGCRRPCEDVADKFCGCVDSTCTGGGRGRRVSGVELPEGEEFNRRWAVYELVKEGKGSKSTRRTKKARASK